ncbi:glucocorticoid receptor isoform X1 [Oncorhynchus tshawytscha]|uniref:glucocorticoid receptor isoform X1 n=1 Tax=Oncorhynchus tshawytscha TaxID=74940 RepID=UPI000D0A44FE|nr:glucocorticoid receptor isoform X1 [Oncorhynchus tshawytscha]XP_024265238.1 glucocorticoid receptor isoform X1 [Oncorhynchus tshawytscha]
MDQGGVKKSRSNNDNSRVKLLLGETPSERTPLTGAPCSAMSVALATTTTSFLPSSQLMQPGDVPSGLSNSPPPSGEDLASASVTASVGLYLEDPEPPTTKLLPQQTNTSLGLGLFTLGDTYSRLEDSIADFHRSSPSMDSLIGGSDPNLFPMSMRTETDFSRDQDLMDMDQEGYIGKDQKLFNDNTLDLLQDFELTGSPSDFYVGDDAFLSSLADDTLLGDESQDRGVSNSTSKPAATTTNSGGFSGSNTTTLNGSNLLTCQDESNSSTPMTGNSPTPNTFPVVKLEKESGFIQLCTPGVIKQEKTSAIRSYSCRMSGSTGGSTSSSPSELSSASPISICGVSTSGGQSYHFGVNSSINTPLVSTTSGASQQKDQKPSVFSLYPPLVTVGEAWNNSSYGDGASGMQGLSSPTSSFSSSFASSTSRQGGGAASCTTQGKAGTAHKICLVCSDEASGCHYGVLTCGSCKVFFKRAVEGTVARGQHNYLCAGRKDCIIDKIRRKNCPACRFRKCLMAGMNLEARKTKKLNRLKGVQQPTMAELTPRPLPEARSLVPKSMPQLTPTMLSLLKAIEPDTIYSGYDGTLPDTSTRIMTTLNRLGGRQVVSAVKWAKSLPGFRNLHLDDQMTLLQCSWLFLMSFGLGWRSYQQCDGNMLCFAPDLVINQDRMKLPYMADQCEQMLKISSEFVRLQVSHDEYLCMKVLLLLSTVPKDGLKSQAVFDEIRMSYIKELGKAIVKREENSSQNWQRFYQLTKLLDSMHEMVGGLLNFCFYTFVNKSLSVEFPEMLAEIISNQLPKFKAGSVKPLLFHQK